ncbi:NB-ARC domain-containing protein [Thermopolyspora sp. NPDC052614]|uniref:NB-ARC domain-containing protein n=1 Tax=Thermopolyspora sp. NPDC052614 TaxID=3155682 RepID=UPI00342D89EF
MNGVDPAEVRTRAELRACLAEVKRRAGLSLAGIEYRSDELVRGMRGRRISGTGWPPMRLTRSNISGFTGGGRPQLPSEQALVTFLVVCGVAPARLQGWLAALRRARASYEHKEHGPPPLLPRLPDHFVPREAERRHVVEELEALTACGGGAVGLASTAALHGTGGFGKTTLALDVCRLDRVRALFPDGIVWLEVGQNPVLTTLLADAAARVTGRPPARFGSVDAAAAGLGEALEGRRVLLVLDNVWSPGDLEPFLRGGSGCVRLVTSRRADVLPREARVIPVERMSPRQAIDLLGKDVPGASRSLLFPLYERSHRWPVVLGILNGVLRARTVRAAGMPLERVVADLVRRLDARGLTGADDLADVESRTVREVLEIGVQDLAADPRGQRLRERFLSLGAFPPDQTIGFDALAELWECDDLEVRSVCDRLADRSLLGSAEASGVRLHDVIRDHVLSAHRPYVEEWAARLLAVSRSHCAQGRWDLIDDAYAGDLDRLAYLLMFTGGADHLRELLFDLRFMVRRTLQGGVAGLAADVAVLRAADEDDPRTAALSRVVDLEGHLAMRVEDPVGVAATLWARLSGDPLTRRSVAFRDEALAEALVATGPMPDRPDGRQMRVLTGHLDRVISLSWQPDGAKLAAGAADGVIRVWGEAGGALRVIELEAAVNALAWAPDRVHLAALVGESTVCLVEPIFGEVSDRYDADVELTCLAWTPSGLAIGRADGDVVIWDVERGAEQGAERGATRIQATGSRSAIRAMQWAAGVGLVLVHGDGTAAVLAGDPASGVTTGLNSPRGLTVRPGGAQVVIGGASHGLALADFGRRPPDLVGTSEKVGWVTSVDWSHDGAWLAAGLQDGAVALWSADGGESGPGASDDPRDPDDPDDPRDRHDPPERTGWRRTFSARPRLDYNGQRVAAVSWHPRRALLAVAAQNDARIFNLEEPSATVRRFGVNCLRCHPYRGVIAGGGVDGRLILVDTARPDAPRVLDAHREGVRALAYSPDGSRLLTVAEHGPLLLWDVRELESGREPRPVAVRSPVQLPGAVAWSPDGSSVAVAGNKEIAVMESRDLAVTRLLEAPDLANGLDFDPTGRWLALATTGSAIGVYAVDGRAVRWLTGHKSSVGAIRWIDESRVVSAGYDGQAVVWSPWETGESVMTRTIDGGGGAVWDVTATPSWVGTVTSAGFVGLRSLDPAGPSCVLALDTALSSCEVTSDGTAMAVGGAAGVALFDLPAWARTGL